MRHYEDFELENLKNRTGSALLRFRCEQHLRRCAICRQRYEQLVSNDTFLSDVRDRLTRLQKMRDENDAPPKE